MTKPKPSRWSLVALLIALAPVAQAWQAKAPNADAEITFNTGLTHLREGRTEMALESFKKAIARDPKNAYFHKALGIAYSQLADKCPPADSHCRLPKLAEAVAAARKAIELNPYYVDARNDLGIWLLRSGRREEGKRELLTAYEDPTNPTPEHSARNLGQAYLEDKDPMKAQVWFYTAVQRNKNYADAYLSLADSLLAQNKVDEAVSQLESGVKDNPDEPGLMLALGQAYHRAGRFADARSRWEKVAAKDPSGPAGRRALELLRTLQQR
jgi:Flp pilus assembly protein TadD